MTTVTRKELAEVIGERTLHIAEKGTLATAVAAYLAGEHRAVDLNTLMRDVMQYRLEHGLIEAVAVSAHELPPVVIKDITALLHEHYPAAQHIVVDTRLDGSVVGGIRLELPQETLDLSIKAKLNLFKRLVAEERN